MLKDLEKELKKAEELDYQSAENYPWEYSVVSEEIFVADLNMLKDTQKNLVAEPVDDSEANTTTKTEELPLQDQLAESLTEQDQEVVEENQVTEDQVQENLAADSLDDAVDEDVQGLETALSKLEQNDFSWLFMSLALLFILAGGEWLLYFLKNHFFWSDQNILLFIWLWRLVLVLAWFYFAMVKKNYLREKVIASAIAAFVVGVFILGIWKIWAIKSIWTWLNVFIEPIWVLLLVAVVASIFVKIFKNN